MRAPAEGNGVVEEVEQEGEEGETSEVGRKGLADPRALALLGGPQAIEEHWRTEVAVEEEDEQ
jgi:hypothetical protein